MSARRYRIAFIGGRGIGGSYSGIETFYEEAGSRLAARGHELTVYCRPHFSPPLSTHRGMRVQMLPAPRSKHFETLVHSFLSVVHASAQAYDIVHIHAIGSSIFSWMPRLRGIRTVVTVHGLDWQRPKWHTIARHCLRFAEWASVTLPSGTTAVSEAVADSLRARYHADVVVVPNGISQQLPASPDVVREFGLEPGRFVLFVGRLSEEKCCRDLIRAFARAAVPNFTLVLAGGATYASSYEADLRSMAGPNVRFLGWVDQQHLRSLYQHCALFVLPSMLEGLSVALLEAMSHGAPVLVSDIAPNLETMGDAGWSFRTGDVAHLAEQLTLLLRSPERLRQGGAAARLHAESEYEWDVVVRRLERVYESICDGTPAASDTADRNECVSEYS